MSEMLKQPQYVIEGIILRRLHEKRIEGYTIETAKEIAEAVAALQSSAVSANDWREDPSSDERWNAGCDFALERLCGLLGVNPKSVSWDAATETVEGDVSAVIGNILCAKYGEDWGPSVELGFTDVLSKRIGWLRYAMYNVEIGRCRDARECAHEALHIDDVVAGKTTIPAPAPLRTEPQTAPIGYVSQATLRLLSERGQAGHICPVPAYDTLIPVYASPVQRCQAVSEQPSPAVTNSTEERDMTTEYLQGVVDRVSVQRKREEYPDPSPEMLNGDPLFDALRINEATNERWTEQKHTSQTRQDGALDASREGQS
jgi:hypothetical protein